MKMSGASLLGKDSDSVQFLFLGSTSMHCPTVTLSDLHHPLLLSSVWRGHRGEDGKSYSSPAFGPSVQLHPVCLQQMPHAAAQRHTLT